MHHSGKKIQQMSTQISTLIYPVNSVSCLVISSTSGLKGNNSLYKYNVITFRKYFLNENNFLMS